ncbi:hypothetical protein FB451DRAFT_1077110, partial [Mycena latifolia]
MASQEAFESSDKTRRLHLRTRLSELNALMAELATERQNLQAESDSIICPILSFPPEITTEIFLKCIPSDSASLPSPATAPLLLNQICRQWRQIALNAPDLWRSLAFADDSSVELLKIWLLRTGPRPLKCSFRSEDASRAGPMIETAMLHSHHWQDLSFGLPLASIPRLNVHQPLPMLRSLSLDIQQRDWNEVTPETIVIQNAPMLREVHLSTTVFDLKFDIPWHQLTTLTLPQYAALPRCLAWLGQCSRLVHLVVGSEGSAPINISVTLTQLESLTCNMGFQPMLHMTLPRLQRLTINDVRAGQEHIFQSFIRRSACSLKYISLGMTAPHARTLRLCLHAVDSVTEVALRVPGQVNLSEVLQLDTVPQLMRLHVELHVPRLPEVDYTNLVAILRAYRTPSPDRVILDSFILELSVYSERLDLHYRPSGSALSEFRVLAAGMDIKVTISGMSPVSKTRVVFDSSTFSAEQQQTIRRTYPENARRLYVRARLAEVNAMMAALTVEHKRLQAESDYIIYPVLSLPADIIVHIFPHCIPPGVAPRPSPSTAPLLLTQICRQWRHIALNTPELWQS